MRRFRRDGFTLLEVMAVVAIILVLAGLLVAGAQIAQQTAKKERSKAVLNILATACEDYWRAYHDYPNPNPDRVGLGTNTLGTNAAFRAAYYHGGWTNDAYNITLVYLLSVPRQPEPFINLQQRWFKKTEEDINGPDGRKLYKVLDGFDQVIRVDRPEQYYYVNTYIRLTSAGPDGAFGSGTTDPKAKDNAEVYLKR